MDVDHVIKLVFIVVVGKWQNGPLQNRQQRTVNIGLSRNILISGFCSTLSVVRPKIEFVTVVAVYSYTAAHLHVSQLCMDDGCKA